MPEVDRKIFRRSARFDGKPGYREVVPTTMRYVEGDGTDIRVYRVRVYDQSGNLIKTHLQDTMGVPFADLPDVEDDLDYLESLGE